ncbi:hypothetical protein K470DRAFT_22283 [Piedraia hortae CBS 480.64]|uniref:Uncharacterized protein n=1 Tax=Piedraia hortae CBS 480.64 TaxID=1314780 RepID=A0A6A7C3A7_9PEZI|nr:hypothetical protein K470DRAFT_22283 [Piedraia hortae CBS 480.64]
MRSPSRHCGRPFVSRWSTPTRRTTTASSGKLKGWRSCCRWRTAPSKTPADIPGAGKRRNRLLPAIIVDVSICKGIAMLRQIPKAKNYKPDYGIGWRWSSGTTHHGADRRYNSQRSDRYRRCSKLH